MTESLDSLVAKMQEWLHVDDIRLPDNVAATCLNLIQREALRDHDLRFGEDSTTLALTIGDRSYDLPAGWSRPLNLWYLTSNNIRVDLVRLERDDFDALYVDGSDNGKPQHYTVWGSELLVGPTPDEALSVTVNYYRFLDDLTTGPPGNTNAFMTNAWDILFFGALAFASQYMIEDARQPMWQGLYMQKLSKLAAEHRREKATGRIPQSRYSA